ncbi:putative pilus assembly protein FilE [Acinetobacter higginsii]|uniref:putative pilus assembly protein FilE n=1 Tax=Acinetobacter higginsii TaxID=70347 RepID=UPI001F4A3989|nr:putative pilus assembly protein FilE [Acinetobacter higginsii]MCH7337981.1 putative pilus assembly protein FilE [Acinetobacter higginsii]
MQKKMILQPRLVISLVCLMIASTSVVYADGFYTIIGPDGRPMVVPMKLGKKQAEPNQQKQQVRTEKTAQLAPPIDHSNPVKTVAVPIEQQTVEYTQPIELPKKQFKTIKNFEVPEAIREPMPPSKVIDKRTTKVPVLPVEQSNVIQAPTSQLKIENSATEKKSTAIEEKSQNQSDSNSSNKGELSTGFSQVDGVDYVNNEYLENQEFNLDGKKRFYTIPDGTGRTETIERKKGVSRSVLDKLLNRSQQSVAPIALSTTYVRLSSEDLKVAFENDRCFLDGYKKSIKTLALKKDVGLWPRKPLKETFEYELVKLDSSPQYMQIDSYSPRNEKPVYYWPLVVFLDENGCIEEGVSGFKNSETAATALQHSAIQGVIKIPKEARYIMMTPLASAIDVSEQELSNQGQIKISVLQ